MQLPFYSTVLLCAFSPILADALSLDVTDPASVKNASSVVAKDLLSYYHASDPFNTPGLFGYDSHGGPYYWWEAGAVWGSLIDYWNYTGDDQYVSLVQQALLWQLGPDNDYMVPNQTTSEGNDDQAIWALAALRAAELRFPITKIQFPDNTSSTATSWLDLAVNVFNDQAARWDTSTCDGGLRWQIFTFNDGYDYKNTMAAGAFFQLAARLARYTGNQTYGDWATKSYDWTSTVGFISDDYRVFDGAFVKGNCSAISRFQWTYAAATFMYGSAVMTNFTNTNATWKARTNDLLSSMSVFFTGGHNAHDNSTGVGIMTEVACEPAGLCPTDAHIFKALTAQWMGEAVQVAPFTKDKILGYLQSSAEGAAKQCSGGANGTACGTLWTETKYDGKTGLGQELSAMNVFLANLAVHSSAATNVNTTEASTTVSKGTTPSSSPTSTTSGNSTTPSVKPSSGSERSWAAASWPLSLLIPTSLLFSSLL